MTTSPKEKDSLGYENYLCTAQNALLQFQFYIDPVWTLIKCQQRVHCFYITESLKCFGG